MEVADKGPDTKARLSLPGVALDTNAPLDHIPFREHAFPNSPFISLDDTIWSTCCANSGFIVTKKSYVSAYRSKSVLAISVLLHTSHPQDLVSIRRKAKPPGCFV
jgi:hypothetical protein